MYNSFLNEKMKGILRNIIDLIPVIDIPIFFDLLIDVVVKVDIEDYLIDLTSALTKRIMKELKKKFNVIKRNSQFPDKDNSSFSYINKCFNVVRAITESPSYVQSHIVIFSVIIG